MPSSAPAPLSAGAAQQYPPGEGLIPVGGQFFSMGGTQLSVFTIFPDLLQVVLASAAHTVAISARRVQAAPRCRRRSGALPAQVRGFFLPRNGVFLTHFLLCALAERRWWCGAAGRWAGQDPALSPRRAMCGLMGLGLRELRGFFGPRGGGGCVPWQQGPEVGAAVREGLPPAPFPIPDRGGDTAPRWRSAPRWGSSWDLPWLLVTSVCSGGGQLFLLHGLRF